MLSGKPITPLAELPKQGNKLAIAIFLAASTGVDPIFMQVASALGTLLAELEITIIYGGTTGGTMEALAKSALAARGKVIGILTKHLENTLQPGLTEWHLYDTVTEREEQMYKRANAFIVLPGGTGTGGEFFHTVSRAKRDSKPIGILNVAEFYDWLVLGLDKMQGQDFLKKEHRSLVKVKSDPKSLVKELLESPEIQYRAIVIKSLLGAGLFKPENRADPCELILEYAGPQSIARPS